MEGKDLCRIGMVGNGSLDSTEGRKGGRKERKNDLLKINFLVHSLTNEQGVSIHATVFVPLAWILPRRQRSASADNTVVAVLVERLTPDEQG